VEEKKYVIVIRSQDTIKQKAISMENIENPVSIPSGSIHLEGELLLPDNPKGVVLFAHGSGSSRMSPRNRFVAEVIREAKIGTLLFDLLTPEEESVDMFTRQLRFDIGLLTRRLVDATDWLLKKHETHPFTIGYFGSSTGAAAALSAAAHFGKSISAVISRGGRPDLAESDLLRVTAPTLLIVGGLDDVVIELNKGAMEWLKCEKKLAIVPGATHLFEELGTLEQVAQLAANWFRNHL
jgi:pimeloyl-ACP methyl ester carboxylesterase